MTAAVDDFALINTSLVIYAFETLNSVSADHEATDIAASNCTAIMKSTGLPFKCYSRVAQHLNLRHHEMAMDDHWLSAATLLSRDSSASYSLLLHQYSAAHEHSNQDRTVLFEHLRREIAVCLGNGHFSGAQTCVETFASIVQFSSKPASTSEFSSNAYCHFSFLSLLVAIYHYCLAPRPSSMDMDEEMAGSIDIALKSIETILAKIETYRAKNERYFVADSLELYYYRLSRLLYLLMLFRTMKLGDFSDEFTELLLSPGLECQQCQTILETDGATNLRSLLLAMYGVSQILARPLSESLRDFRRCDWLQDQVFLDASSVEYALYTTLMEPLAAGDNARARTALRPDSPLYLLASAYLFPFLPQEQGESDLGYKSESNPQSEYESMSACSLDSPSHPSSFWLYLERIVDYKTFLLVISFSTQISLDSVLQLTGYSDQIDPATKNLILQSWLRLVSALGLGNQGLRYDVRGRIFYFDTPHQRNGSDRSSGGELRLSIDQLAWQVRGNALAALVHGMLLEKYGF